MGFALPGCEPSAPPLTRVGADKSDPAAEERRQRYQAGAAVLRRWRLESPEAACYADVIEPYAGEERKVGFSTLVMSRWADIPLSPVQPI